MDGFTFKDEFWNFIRISNLCLEHAVRPLAQSHGLTMLQLKALIEVEGNYGITVSILADRMGFTNGNTSSMCKKMEKDGWIIRERNETDERCVNLFITDEGKEILIQIKESISCRYDPILHRCSESQIEEIERSMSLLNDIVKLVYQECILKEGEK